VSNDFWGQNDYDYKDYAAENNDNWAARVSSANFGKDLYKSFDYDNYDPFKKQKKKEKKEYK
jgi:hypothetical protein